MIESNLKSKYCYLGLSKQLSTVAILRFQFGLSHIVSPSSFLRSISLALFPSLSIFGWSDLLQMLRKRTANSLSVLNNSPYSAKIWSHWKNGVTFEKMVYNVKNGSHYEISSTFKKLRHSVKSGSLSEKWVTFGKKWVTLWKMRHTFKNGTHCEKCVTLWPGDQMGHISRNW